MLTVRGIFKDNEIITPEGEVIECITYRSVLKVIQGQEGFFNLEDHKGQLIIKQYVLMDGTTRNYGDKS